MDTHHCGQLDGFENLFLGRPCLNRILHVAACARAIKMCGRGINRDHDEFFIFLWQRASVMRDRTERQIGFQILWIKRPQLVPDWVPIAFGDMRFGCRV